jgi:formylglycine-generating enzyme required for sulfatase activity
VLADVSRRTGRRANGIAMRSAVVVACCVFVSFAFAAAAAVKTPLAVDPKALPVQSETEAAPGYAPCAAAPRGMSCIPGGPAIVGDEKSAGSPRRVIEVSTFYLDQKEITHADYQRCVDAKICKPLFIPDYNKNIMKPFMGADQPAMPLDWPRAQQYCVWAGKRLPTEWEWEKAARGPNGDAWPWGNAPFSCDKAQTRDCAPKGCKPYRGKAHSWDCVEHATHAAGSFPAGHYGLFDMAGNGNEWTATWYVARTAACGARCNGKDPRGPCDGANPCPKQPLQKVLRSGSWYWPKSQAQPSHRRGEMLETRSHRLGARCASTTTTQATLPPRAVTEQRPAPATPQAPSAEQLKTFTAIKEDVLAKQVCEQKGRSFVDCRDPNHYIKTNEPRLHVWRPYIENLGGGYTGVGIDQNYSFIAHARSEWAWLFDYDPAVVHLHWILRAIILDSPDRQAFLAHYAPAAKDDVLALLSKTYAGNPERAAYRELYAISRASLAKYYQHQVEGEVSIPDIVKAPTADADAPRRKAGVKVGDESADPSFGWLATEESYQYIRNLYQQGRIHILKGDMLAKNTMQGIGAAARAMGVTIRIYYPSNAPECWPFTEQYKKNVLALPFDDKSIVLQTLSGIKAGFGKQIGYWHYNVQAGLQQQELLSRRGYGALRQVVFERLPGADPDLTTSGLPGSG